VIAFILGTFQEKWKFEMNLMSIDQVCLFWIHEPLRHKDEKKDLQDKFCFASIQAFVPWWFLTKSVKPNLRHKIIRKKFSGTV
jgi:hypothetical protein